MKTYIVEIRDRNTYIPAAVLVISASNAAQRYHLGRSGWSIDGTQCILTKLSDGNGRCDAYDWDDRTMQTAHNYISDSLYKGYPIADGQVIDVEYILGETKEPKLSESRTSTF